VAAAVEQPPTEQQTSNQTAKQQTNEHSTTDNQQLAINIKLVISVIKIYKKQKRKATQRSAYLCATALPQVSKLLKGMR